MCMVLWRHKISVDDRLDFILPYILCKVSKCGHWPCEVIVDCEILIGKVLRSDFSVLLSLAWSIGYIRYCTNSLSLFNFILFFWDGKILCLCNGRSLSLSLSLSEFSSVVLYQFQLPICASLYWFKEPSVRPAWLLPVRVLVWYTLNDGKQVIILLLMFDSVCVRMCVVGVFFMINVINGKLPVSCFEEPFL